MMAAQRVLVALMIAFALATAIASVTTVREVRIKAPSVAQPIKT